MVQLQRSLHGIRNLYYYLFDFPTAKSAGNLLLQVYHLYCSELCQALSSEANELCNDKLASGQESDRAALLEAATAGLRAPLKNAEALVRSVERRIAAEGTSKPLMEVCELLEARPGSADLIAKIKAHLGRLHYTLRAINRHS